MLCFSKNCICNFIVAFDIYFYLLPFLRSSKAALRRIEESTIITKKAPDTLYGIFRRKVRLFDSLHDSITYI